MEGVFNNAQADVGATPGKPTCEQYPDYLQDLKSCKPDQDFKMGLAWLVSGLTLNNWAS
ncbi:UNVERIFIED_CONTAM: hypothetical protein Sradi_2168200 [Sesamum radiatum]|uniref:Uncharacterized protein n=1 Tax=Sesamum radiatum TaxID=300843 RepID=A0AAW2T0Y2_SESRA